MSEMQTVGELNLPVFPTDRQVPVDDIATAINQLSQALGNAALAIQTAPVGTIVAYAGAGDPPDGVGTWVIADGRLISSSTYPAFDAKAGSGGGHKYNSGVSPGAGMCRIPDKRGKKSMGAINMGSAAGAGANDNAHFQAVQGTSYGEVAHPNVSSENAPHSHGGQTGTSTTGGQTVNHTHQLNGDGSVLGAGAGFSQQQAAQPVNSNQVTVGDLLSPLINVSTSDGTSNDHAHFVPALSIAADGGGAPHNNIDPTEADSYLVRIA